MQNKFLTISVVLSALLASVAPATAGLFLNGVNTDGSAFSSETIYNPAYNAEREAAAQPKLVAEYEYDDRSGRFCSKEVGAPCIRP